MKKYIRCLAALLGAFALAVALVGCGGGSGSAPADEKPAEEAEQAQPAEDATQEEEAEPEEAAAESPYAVTIDGAETGTDWEGNPCVIVTYTFTNNSEEATSFMVALSAEVYQDGVQLDRAICDDVDPDPEMNNVKTGASIQVQIAYELSSTSDVEVEVYELWDFDHTMLANQTFSVE